MRYAAGTAAGATRARNPAARDAAKLAARIPCDRAVAQFGVSRSPCGRREQRGILQAPQTRDTCWLGTAATLSASVLRCRAHRRQRDLAAQIDPSVPATRAPASAVICPYHRIGCIGLSGEAHRLRRAPQRMIYVASAVGERCWQRSQWTHSHGVTRHRSATVAIGTVTFRLIGTPCEFP